MSVQVEWLRGGKRQDAGVDQDPGRLEGRILAEKVAWNGKKEWWSREEMGCGA